MITVITECMRCNSRLYSFPYILRFNLFDKIIDFHFMLSRAMMQQRLLGYMIVRTRLARLATDDDLPLHNSE